MSHYAYDPDLDDWADDDDDDDEWRDPDDEPFELEKEDRDWFGVTPDDYRRLMDQMEEDGREDR